MTDPTSMTADDPSPRGGWMVQWTESLYWPSWEIPVVMQSVASQLISMTARFAAPTQDEIIRQELDAVRATTAALEQRVAALEVLVREVARQEDDSPDVPRLSLQSRDAFREVLARAGELAAQRGLKTTTDSATVVGDRGLEMHAEAAPPARRSRKAPRKPRRRA